MDFWISGFQFGFLPTVYEISFVTDPSGPAGTAAAGPMLEAKLMNLIKGRLQKF